MSKLLTRNLSFLNSLSKATPKEQSKIISEATEDNIRALSEVVLNILNGNLKISSQSKTELKKYKAFLRNFSKNQTSFDKNKKHF